MLTLDGAVVVPAVAAFAILGALAARRLMGGRRGVNRLRRRIWPRQTRRDRIDITPALRRGRR
jgi:hypothetical protein